MRMVGRHTPSRVRGLSVVAEQELEQRLLAACNRLRGPDDASSTAVRAATVYGLKTLLACLRLELHRLGLVRSPKFIR
jgi:hypothetical protein